MAFQTLSSGSWRIRWPTTLSEWNGFLNTWGLTPNTAVKALALGHYAESLLGLRLWIISGHRSRASQQDLWERRATNPFPVARPGTSRHETRSAFDIGADFALTAEQWRGVGTIGRALGLRWGGDFARPDRPHFEE